MPFKTVGRIVSTISFPEDIYERLEKVIDAKCMNRSRYVIEALRVALSKDEEQISKKKETNA